jgi:phosphoribosylformylglycinamidine synthase
VRVRVLVRLKPSILDVQGAAVKRALVGLGFGEVTDLRVGKMIEIELQAATEAQVRERAEAMCRKLLANPLLEDYTVEPLSADDLAGRETVR